MIRNIIELLNTDDYLVGDEDIDFAKGSKKLPTTWVELKANIKRRLNGSK